MPTQPESIDPARTDAFADPATSGGARSASLAVLVVDPGPATAVRVREALSGFDIEVWTARDRDEALSLAHGTDLALVLCAASLPKGSGYDLARAVRERWPAAVVLLMTSGFEVYNKARAAEAGVSGHLTKPLATAAVRAAVEDAVGTLPLAVPAVPQSVGAPLNAPPPAGFGAAGAPPASAFGGAAGGAAAPAPPTLPPGPRLDPIDPMPPAPPISAERVATFLPRDHARLPRVAVDPAVVAPALERAVLEVLPEVVEAVLRNAVGSSTAFRELVQAAVADAVRAQLPEIAAAVVRERLAAFEAEAAAKV